MKFLELKTILRNEGIVPPSSDGGSFNQFFRMLYHIRLLKYIRQSHLKLYNPKKLSNPPYAKYCALDKLKFLVKLELLHNPQDDIFIAKDSVLPHLNYFGFDVSLLPEESKGKGEINEINNTEVFIQALNMPLFRTLLYHSFGYIRPDALLVRMDGSKYKLDFLEVEASKSSWDNWIEDKRINYLKLAQDKQVYDYWLSVCETLNIPRPSIKDFKFSVLFVGKINFDFGKGFNFLENL